MKTIILKFALFYNLFLFNNKYVHKLYLDIIITSSYDWEVISSTSIPTTIHYILVLSLH